MLLLLVGVQIPPLGCQRDPGTGLRPAGPRRRGPKRACRPAGAHVSCSWLRGDGRGVHSTAAGRPANQTSLLPASETARGCREGSRAGVPQSGPPRAEPLSIARPSPLFRGSHPGTARASLPRGPRTVKLVDQRPNRAARPVARRGVGFALVPSAWRPIPLRLGRRLQFSSNDGPAPRRFVVDPTETGPGRRVVYRRWLSGRGTADIMVVNGGSASSGFRRVGGWPGRSVTLGRAVVRYPGVIDPSAKPGPMPPGRQARGTA